MRATGRASTERSGLARADAILAAFDGAHATLSLPGIVARTGLPKTTVYRAIQKMLELGWLERDHDRYTVGPRLLELAALTHLRTDLREAALPYMQDLYEATHETIHLAVLDDGHVLYLEKLSSHRWSTTDRGGARGRRPAHCTAVGKVVLAFAPADVIDRVVGHGPPARTSTSPRTLRTELERVRSEGVAFDREETGVGVESVAAPLFGPNGECVAAMSITCSLPQFRLDGLASAVRTAALGASRALRPDPDRFGWSAERNRSFPPRRPGGKVGVRPRTDERSPAGRETAWDTSCAPTS